MKKTLITLAAVVATGFGATALADEAVSGPVMMTDAQMDKIVAGNPNRELWTSQGQIRPGPLGDCVVDSNVTRGPGFQGRGGPAAYSPVQCI